MKSFDAKAKAKNLTFLNECGLDPGIDHIATLRLRDSIHEKGGKIISYQSYCGALFAPEYLEGNPFGYKFSWSPIGVLKALKNSSIYLNENKIVKIPQKNVLHSASNFPGNDILKLITYPNRNSVPYKEIYGLKDCSTVVRGTIRYQGFCEILAGFNDLGLLEDFSPDSSVTSWPELIQSLVASKNLSSNLANFGKVKSLLMEEFKLKEQSSVVNYEKLIHILSSHDVFKKYSEQESIGKLRKVFEGMLYLEIFEDSSKISSSLLKKSMIEILCEIMKKKLSAKKGDRDLVVMVHYLHVKNSNNQSGRVRNLIIRIYQKFHDSHRR